MELERESDRELNPQQLEAVKYTEGPLIVFAGAGSGKTKVLTYRIAHLLKLGVSPFQIMAVTFTNRAATEMRERVQQLVGDGQANDVWVRTFHSMAVRILRREERYLSYDRNFLIYDSADQITVMKQCIAELRVDDRKFRPRGVLAEISSFKNELVTPKDYHGMARNVREETIADLYSLYQKKLLQHNAMDFDDLLVQTVELFRSEPLVLEHYQRRFQYIMVDEYQDTNHVQYVLVHQLAGDKRNLCVVGDDDQSIHGWRGADIRNILNFERDFPDVYVIMLEQNYRSTQCILAVANALISHNRGRKPKELWTSNDVGDPVSCYQALDEKDEARFVAAEISDLVEREEALYRDCAVFYRTHAQSRVIEEEFIRSGIPYRIYGGVRFYERKEIKDILAYLRLVANPADEVSLRRVINEPRRGIGDTTIARAEEFASSAGRSLAAVLEHPEEIPNLGNRAVNALKGFFQMINSWRKLDGAVSVAGLVERILGETGYLSALETQKTVEAETRIENLNEFLGVVQQYDSEGIGGTLVDFLEGLALVTDIDNYEPGEDAVVLMTIHGAKGMEFPMVFLTGLEEGLFPHVHSLEENEVEEERRLCYVAITRAKQKLYLSWAIRRFIYGNSEYKLPSRFFKEIPQEYLCPVVPDRFAGHGGHGDGSAVPSGGGQGDGSGVPSGGSQTGHNAGHAIKESAAGEREAAAVTAAPSQTSFQVGETVEHKKFGKGVVMETKTGPGGDMEIYVSFETAGFKHLLAKYAPIKKA
ncbi:MAG TPA: DNA helicase PcrA [Peptococcaceae bacterium]|nr:DNA helicase PcrA [Peptococcaceae bacterium]